MKRKQQRGRHAGGHRASTAPAPKPPAGATERQLLEQAVALHQRGELAQAEALYLRILQTAPSHFDAKHLLGAVRHQQGFNAEALALIDAALALKPEAVEAHSNRGIVLDALGRKQEALASYERAIALKPDDATSHYNRANSLKELKRLAEALKAYDAALKAKPDYPEALFNRGNLLVELDRPADALASYDRALALRPRYLRALVNRGNALQKLKRHREALASYEQALALKPDYPEAHLNRGNALCELGDLGAAEAAFRQALALKPDYPEAYWNMSDVLMTCGRAEEAIAWNRNALSLKPADAAFHTCLIFNLNFDHAGTTAAHQAERARWYERHGARFTAEGTRHCEERSDEAIQSDLRKRPLDCFGPSGLAMTERRLRVGYVSAHFRRQAATYAFGGVLTAHDPALVEVVCYSDAQTEDDITARLRARAALWRETAALDDAALADLVQADRIDILVDCVGHMGGHRLGVFARKPSPIQVTAWGEPTGTGLATMDYLLADPVLVPQAERHLLAEEVIDLPNFLGYWMPEELAPPRDPPALAAGHVTFGSFNRLAKISDRVLDLWAAVLRAVPDSRLILKDARAASQLARLRARFAAASVDPDRLTLLGPAERTSHFEAYHRLDIALDPFPHGGGMTTLDALWMGVPVVTAPGATISSRLAAASLTALGLTDFIAPDLDAYVALAAAKARDIAELARLRKTLRARVATSAFGDARRYAAAVEAAYRSMWRRWCAAERSV